MVHIWSNEMGSLKKKTNKKSPPLLFKFGRFTEFQNIALIDFFILFS